MIMMTSAKVVPSRPADSRTLWCMKKFRRLVLVFVVTACLCLFLPVLGSNSSSSSMVTAASKFWNSHFIITAFDGDNAGGVVLEKTENKNHNGKNLLGSDDNQAMLSPNDNRVIMHNNIRGLKGGGGGRGGGGGGSFGGGGSGASSGGVSFLVLLCGFFSCYLVKKKVGVKTTTFDFDDLVSTEKKNHT